MNEKKKNLFDLATTITIGGIVLYQMSWIYWTNYFSNLNIDSSFIDMPIEKFIATTWYLIVITPLSFIITIVLIYESDDEKLDIPSTAFATIISISLIFFLVKDDNMILYVTFGTCAFYALYTYLQHKLNLSKLYISKTKFFYFTLGIMYIISSKYYAEIGNRASKRLITNFKTNNIEITLNHDNKVLKGKFIIHMKEKYFILVKNEKHKNETVIINDNEIYNSRMIK
ncbi:hypothetical protein QQY79_13715 [Flavobacterium tructae]|uniref:hypothetical protein n=1 Tax=Flavobacterium tructae TaxID=1114873 RepID=UPI002551DF72|nr:hypothetical protein [Flavobacterium tructae]MDL2143583.1 hypothetical protein [Flavobacterium tructae]